MTTYTYTDDGEMVLNSWSDACLPEGHKVYCFYANDVISARDDMELIETLQRCGATDKEIKQLMGGK